jgi:branched-chain amino acid transport system ATP-binding protein
VRNTLNIRNLRVAYNNVIALHDVSLDINRGEVVAILGPNGAGKTSLLNAVVGTVAVNRGFILFNGTDTTHIPTYRLVRMGVTIVPEDRKLFTSMSVRENLELGAYASPNNRKSLDWVLGFFPILGERMDQTAGTLSGGEQQMLAIARALMSNPELLLLDDPSLGLAPVAVNNVFEAIAEISDSGITILLADENLGQAAEIADRVYLLANGTIDAEYKGGDISSLEHVRRVLLGA